MNKVAEEKAFSDQYFINTNYADKTFLPFSLLLAKTFLPELELIRFLKP